MKEKIFENIFERILFCIGIFICFTGIHLLRYGGVDLLPIFENSYIVGILFYLNEISFFIVCILPIENFYTRTFLYY